MINKKALKILGITENQYKTWCKDNNKPSYKIETKREFLSNVQKGKLIKDNLGNLVNKSEGNHG